MVVKKVFSCMVLTLFLVSVLFSGCSKPTQSEQGSSKPTQAEGKVIKLGITQIAEHAALDAARSGFLDALASKGYKDGENLEVDFQNAQGDMPTAQTIAQNFASSKKDMILAIATPTAQAAYNATKDIPILITAVTDPVQSELAKSWEKSGTNVTGTSDATPIEKQFELIKKLAPGCSKVGILYNTSEANSEIQVKNAQDIAPKFGFEIITSGATNTNDIPQALDSLLEQVDVLYIPTDNLVASSIPIILAKCDERKIPIISAERGPVDAGALATEGIDYYNLGFQTGLIAVEVINGKNPADMPIEILKETQLVINEDSAKKLGINIPENLKNRAEMVKDGE